MSKQGIVHKIISNLTTQCLRCNKPVI